MLKNKSALIVLVMVIVSLLSVTVLATEVTVPEDVAAVKDYTSADGAVVLNEDITANGCDGAIYAHDGANVTINGGNIKGNVCSGAKCGDSTCGYSMAVWARGEGTTVTINGGSFTHGSDGTDHCDFIYASEGGKIVITGGTFESVTPNWTLNCKDNSGSTITVQGGRFYKFNPIKNSVSSTQQEIILAEGYTVVQDGDWYEVQKLNPAKIIDGTTATLNEDIKANGCDGAIYAKNGANVTINGGNIHGQVCPDDGYSMAVWAKGEGTTVTINGGSFTHDSDGSNHCDFIYASEGGKIVITGGTFESVTPNWTLNCKDNNGSTITVKGGKFYQFDPSNNSVSSTQQEIIVPEEYTVVKNGEWYEVVCAHKKLTKVDAKAATYTAEGNIEYYTCDLCGKWFYDEAATSVISSKLAVITPMLIVVENNNANVSEGAVNEAIKDSEGSTNVEIPVLESDKAVSTVTVPVSSLNELATSNKGLLVETSEVTLTVDSTAVEKIAEQAGSATTVTIEVVKVEEKVLNADQKDAIKNKDVAVILSAKILANGKEISNFGGGKIKVEIPFTPAEGTNGSDYKLIYITDDGKVEEIKSKYVDGVLVAELEHFSEYAIVKDAKAVAGTGSSSAATAPAAAANPNEKDDTPKTGAISLIGLVVVMSVIGLSVLKRD